MIVVQTPVRSSKDREIGITVIVDSGLPTAFQRDLLESYSDYIDIAKLETGSALFESKLSDKINAYKAFGVDVHFGGTLFEYFYARKMIVDYEEYLTECGVSSIEISSGTIDVELSERCRLTKYFTNRNFKVFAEVGKKDPKIDSCCNYWITEMSSLIDAGCYKLIAEGRSSASAGIYKKTGQIKTKLIEGITQKIDRNMIIFEAPTISSQALFINKFGANVNLGNVRPADILSLETLRAGLRYETFS